MEINSQLETAKNDLASMTEKFEALNSEVQDKKAKEFESFGHNMVDSETDIQDSDKKTYMKEQISNKCANKEFDSIEDVKKFTVNMLAVACYEQKLAQKENQKVENGHKEFSVSITKPAPVEQPKTDVESLKDSMDKLNRI